MALINCPTCGKALSSDAISCPSCGHPIRGTGQIPLQPPMQRWNPGVAAVLSLVIPGAGQIYKRQILNGLLWLVFVALGYFLFVIPGVILHIFCIIGAASGDPSK